jgi:hypothetical protein
MSESKLNRFHVLGLSVVVIGSVEFPSFRDDVGGLQCPMQVRVEPNPLL